MEPSTDWFSVKLQEEGPFFSLDAMVKASQSPEDSARAMAYQKLVGGDAPVASEKKSPGLRWSLRYSLEWDTQDFVAPQTRPRSRSSVKRVSKSESVVSPTSPEGGPDTGEAPQIPQIKRSSTTSFIEAVRQIPPCVRVFETDDFGPDRRGRVHSHSQLSPDRLPIHV
jgi:hypothetical protein